MRYVSRAGGVLSLPEAVDRLEAGRAARGIAVTFDDGFADNYANALPVLVEWGVPAAFFLATDYIGTDQVFERDRRCAEANRFLDWGQVREMASAGMTIGAHTGGHVKPCAVQPSAFRQEVERSKNVIEDRLGVACEYFAYPWGRARDLDQRHVDVAMEAGFRAVVATINGTNGTGQDLFRLRRTTIYGGDDFGTFQRVLAGRLDWPSAKNFRCPGDSRR